MRKNAKNVEFDVDEFLAAVQEGRKLKKDEGKTEAGVTYDDAIDSLYGEEKKEATPKRSTIFDDESAPGLNLNPSINQLNWYCAEAKTKLRAAATKAKSAIEHLEQAGAAQKPELNGIAKELKDILQNIEEAREQVQNI